MNELFKNLFPADFLDKTKEAIETLAKKLDSIDKKLDALLEDKNGKGKRSTESKSTAGTAGTTGTNKK